MIVVVPNKLRDAIVAAIDAKLAGRDCNSVERDRIFHTLLNYYNENGIIPDFDLKKITHIAGEGNP